MYRNNTKVLMLDQNLEMLTNSFDEDDETEFTYIINVPLKHHYFLDETKDIDEEVLEHEVNDFPSFLELHSQHGSNKCRNEL